MRLSRIPLVELVVFASCAALPAAESSPREPAPPASQYAPAADLLREVDYFIGRAVESLAEPAGFDLAKQSRTHKDGHTLAALALVLALHDQDFPEKTAMPGLLRAAQRLAAADQQYDLARAALADVQAARAGKEDPQAAARWESVASLAALMKQVPLVHAQLKRGADANRLARMAEQSTAQAAALAAIAQASLVDFGYAKTPPDVEKWRQSCALMRDAAGEVNAAIHAQDSQRVAAGMKRLAASCDACHATFRGP